MKFCIAIRYFSVRKGKMGGRRKGKDPNHGNSTMVKMRRFMVQVRKYDFIYPRYHAGIFISAPDSS